MLKLRPRSARKRDGGVRAELESRSPDSSGAWRPSSEGSPQIRESHGLRCLFDHLEGVEDLKVLDLGMLSEGTAWFVGGQGHRINFVSLLHTFDRAKAELADENGQVSVEAARRIVRMNLDFAPNSFHAVLAWDVLQHLDQGAMRVTIAHCAKILRPSGMIFCLFHGESSVEPIPALNCSIHSESTFSLREVGRRRPSQEFSTRKLETLFPQARAVHFYLKRDAILEVLVLC